MLKFASEVMKNLPPGLDRDAYDAWMQNGNALRLHLERLNRPPMNFETLFTLKAKRRSRQFYARELDEMGHNICPGLLSLCDYAQETSWQLPNHDREIVAIAAQDVCDVKKSSKMDFVHTVIRQGFDPLHPVDSLQIQYEQPELARTFGAIYLGMHPVTIPNSKWHSVIPEITERPHGDQVDVGVYEINPRNLHRIGEFGCHVRYLFERRK